MTVAIETDELLSASHTKNQMLQQQYKPPPPPRCVIEKPKKPKRKKKAHPFECGEVVLSADILLSNKTLIPRQH